MWKTIFHFRLQSNWFSVPSRGEGYRIQDPWFLLGKRKKAAHTVYCGPHRVVAHTAYCGTYRIVTHTILQALEWSNVTTDRIISWRWRGDDYSFLEAPPGSGSTRIGKAMSSLPLRHRPTPLSVAAWSSPFRSTDERIFPSHTSTDNIDEFCVLPSELSFDIGDDWNKEFTLGGQSPRRSDVKSGRECLPVMKQKDRSNNRRDRTFRSISYSTDMPASWILWLQKKYDL